MIVGNVVGCIYKIPDTMILVDEDGNEYPAVLTDEEITLTATPNDIRLGTTAVTDQGVQTGEKDIPAYRTVQGTKIITAGEQLTINGLIAHDVYDYTKLQAIVCSYNTSLSNSVAAEMVSIDDNTYTVQSTDSLAKVIKDHENKIVDLGVVNSFDKPCIIRYFTFKEDP